MKKLLTGAAAVVAGVVMTVGVAAAQTGNVDVDLSGPGSDAKVIFKDKMKVDVDNDTKAKLYNNVSQSADSGDAKVKNNTTGGSATTGDAMNTNGLTVAVSVDNSGAMGDMNCMCAGGNVNVDASGPNAEAKVISKTKTKIDVDNDTMLKVENNVSQSANSGDATVKNNTTAGSATTGDAVNTNTVSVSFTVKN